MLARIMLLIIFGGTALYGYTTHHFYRASYMPNEARFETNLFSSLEVQLAGGAAHHGRDACGHERPLVSLLTSRKEFQSSCKKPGLASQFKLFEANITATQNMCNGFFLQAYIPTRVIKIKTQTIVPEKKEVDWFFTSTFDHLKREACCVKKSGLADCVFLAGWTKNCMSTNYLDFIDATIETGILVPTGRKRKNCSACSIPFGYNGHYAIPLSIDLDAGVLNWLTFGVHGDALFFFRRNHRVCIDNRPFCRSKVRVWPRPLWSVGSFVKADHFAFGLSTALGFSYIQNNRATFRFCNALELPKKKLKLTDPILRKWSMWVVNLMAEYDFSCEEWYVGPKMALFVNIQVAGRNVFKTNMFGGDLMAQCAWCF